MFRVILDSEPNRCRPRYCATCVLDGVSFWSQWSDLNRRPIDYESIALPLSYIGRRTHQCRTTPGSPGGNHHAGMNDRQSRGAVAGWWPEAESNCRHCDFQSHALPTELSGQARRYLPQSRRYHPQTEDDTSFSLAEPTGFEPATFCVTGRYANRYTTAPYELPPSSQTNSRLEHNTREAARLSTPEMTARGALRKQVSSPSMAPALGGWYPCHLRSKNGSSRNETASEAASTACGSLRPR